MGSGSSLQLLYKGDWLGVFCSPNLQESDWNGEMLLARKSEEQGKT